jgi:acyl carrier protein
MPVCLEQEAKAPIGKSATEVRCPFDVDTINRRFRDRKDCRPAPEEAGSTVLMNSGLDSLCFAVLVARLEDQLGVDPFSTSEDVTFPVTLGDFVRVYENAAR